MRPQAPIWCLDSFIPRFVGLSASSARFRQVLPALYDNLHLPVRKRYLRKIPHDSMVLPRLPLSRCGSWSKRRSAPPPLSRMRERTAFGGADREDETSNHGCSSFNPGRSAAREPRSSLASHRQLCSSFSTTWKSHGASIESLDSGYILSRTNKLRLPVALGRTN